MWNLKKPHKTLNITKRKQTHRYREKISGYRWEDRRGKGQGRGKGIKSK